MKTCIIGAGASGLAAARVLQERGLPYDCFELGSDIGGNWRFGNDNGLSSAYESLHINTSKDKMCYRDFPMPDDYPDFPHHSLVLDYFESFAEHFGLREHTQFNTEVEHVQPNDDGTHAVRLRSSAGVRTEAYGAVLVANGHHWKPNWPRFEGTFDGEVMHSHAYTCSDVLHGKRVLVVGVGNSGCDIAAEAAHVARSTAISTRRGAHVVPKYILGRPLDTWVTPISAFIPHAVQRRVFQLLLRLARGQQAAYGFPTPPHPFGAAHPTISSDLLDLVGHGRIAVRPNVQRLDGERVVFEDGRAEAFDLIVYATGYQVAFPFFDEAFIRPRHNYVPLYHRVVPPGIPNLYFIGLIQPLGAVMPLAEAQAEWVADLLEGRGGLPDRSAMWKQIEADQQAIERRYVASARHTMQVDFYPYLRALSKERRRARRRPAEQQPAVSHSPASVAAEATVA